MNDTDIVRALATVMGWHSRPEQSVRRADDPNNPVWADETGYYQFHISDWRPLTNDTHIMAVVDKMVAAYPEIDFGSIYWKIEDGLPMWYACFDNGNKVYACNPDRKRAIAESVLRAKGLWIEEEWEG